MKYFFSALFFLCTYCSVSQGLKEIRFNKKFIDCEDQWVFYRWGDSLFSYGFVYFDEHSGLNIDIKGQFTFTDSGTIKVTSIIDHESEEELNLTKKYGLMGAKKRLDPNNLSHEKIPVAIVIEEMYDPLHIEGTPVWLEFYKKNKRTPFYLYYHGFTHNAWGNCEGAIFDLEEANELSPNDPQILLELGFAYNGTKQYKNAEPVLNKAHSLDPTNCYILKEISYCEVNSDQIEKAAQNFYKRVKNCLNKSVIATMAYTITNGYYQRKDKINCGIWAAETKKWVTPNDETSRYIENISKILYD